MKYARRFALLSLFAVVVCSFSACGRDKDGNVEYKLDSETDTYELVYYTDISTVTELIIPDEFNGKKVTAIGELAINGADTLQRIVIGKNIEYIDKWGVTNCRQLKEIEVSGANERYCSVAGVLFSKDMTELLTYPNANTAKYASDGKLLEKASYNIPDGVITVGHSAFYKCYALESVILPDSVREIGARAFQKTINLTEIQFGAALSTIGEDAFLGCESLTQIQLPETLTSIGSYAFYNAFNLKDVDIKAPQQQVSLGEKWYPTTAGKSINAVITFGDSE